MNRLVMTLLSVSLLTGFTQGRAAEAKATEGDHKTAQDVKEQTTCPVMGGKINKKFYVDHDGQRIYMCCPGCRGALEKDFATYAKKIEDAGESVTKIQTVCPVMGGKINKAQHIDVKGKRIYVCCPGCFGAIKADPDKYIKKLESEGITLDVPPESDASKKPGGGN